MRIMLDNALSGVKAHQQRLEVESHNLANVNTPGFKASRATLAEQAGGGTEVHGIEAISDQGGIRKTDSHLDLAITRSLETSNVDLVDTMVGMMVNERGAQANTATIRTADRVAGEIIDLVK